MIAIIVITLVSFSCMFTAHHGGNRGAGGGGGSGSGRNGQPPTVSWDCSNYPSNYPKCSQLIEDFMGLALGTPTDTTTETNPEISNQNSDVTQICCFLVGLPSARDKCCKEISDFCKDIIPTPADCFITDNGSGNSGRYGGRGHGRGHGHSGGNHGGGPSNRRTIPPDDYNPL